MKTTGSYPADATRIRSIVVDFVRGDSDKPLLSAEQIEDIVNRVSASIEAEDAVLEAVEKAEQAFDFYLGRYVDANRVAQALDAIRTARKVQRLSDGTKGVGSR